MPVFHLDEIARVGGGRGPERTAEERRHLLEDVLARPAWISEGVHIGWTAELFRNADMVVWLDHVSWSRAARQMSIRFVRDAIAGMRRHSGIRKFTRFRDFYGHLVGLAGAVRESHGYYGPTGPTALTDEQHYTRAATETYVTTFRPKLIHCRSAADVDRLVADVV